MRVKLPEVDQGVARASHAGISATPPQRLRVALVGRVGKTSMLVAWFIFLKVGPDIL
ncbi:hypothetical protein HanIR_Chr14g0673711 [Helianthus annuus]|nr:hypothetical protein HanIR_Chr14g0673711 [Helianthus annuus]